MVLHLRHEDLVSLAQDEALCPARQRGTVRCLGGRIAEGVRHQVERLRRVAGEDDLVRPRAHELGDPGPRALEGLGRLLGQLMRPAMHGRVAGEVVVTLGVQHGERLLRGGCGVQVDETASPAHGTIEDREILAYALHVDRARGGGHAHAALPALTKRS